MLYSKVHPVQEPESIFIDGYVMGSSQGYEGKITVKSRLEHDKIVVIGENSTWESFPQSSDSREETVSVEPTSRQWECEECG